MNPLHIMQDKNQPLKERVDAARRLWRKYHFLETQVNEFKRELIELHKEQGIEEIVGQSTRALILPQPPAPLVQEWDRQELLDILGPELFEKYISESRSLKWNVYKEDPHPALNDLIKSSPHTTTTRYHVKFIKKD